MAALTHAWGPSVEEKLHSFVEFAQEKLELNAESLTDGEGDDYEELVTFAKGLSRNLKNTAAAAPSERKGEIMAVMAPAVDLKTDTAGPDLSVGVLRQCLAALLASCPVPEPQPEPPHHDDVKPVHLGAMTLQEAVNHMWAVLDKGQRVEWGEDGFTLDLQRKGRYGEGQDTCSDPLFTTMNMENPFWQAPTTKTFIALLDNYERETGVAEKVTREEKEEMSHFKDALCRTLVLRFVLEYLKVHGKDARCRKLRSMLDLQNLLHDLWFEPYRRFKANDSSGFEHVFVGEESRGKITGLHNWVQYYIEEKKGNVNYEGWVGKQDQDYSDDVNLVSVKFAWDGGEGHGHGGAVEEKPMSTMLCGASVEFEVGLLTLCFLAGEQDGDNPMVLGSERIKVVCHPMKTRVGGAKIGTAYIEMA